MAWPAHSVNEGGRMGIFGGAALLGVAAVSWYMYQNKTLPEHSGQTSNKAAWQQYSGPTHENTDTSKPKGPEQSSKEH
ncbi:hypothetical protein WJX82_000896 [Trebouxia sp. C0006]